MSQETPDHMPPEPASGSIVVLTGAGISKDSGLDTFRDPDGIWARVRIEDVATPEAFARDPEGVHAFYNARRARLLSADIEPNPAHFALAELEKKWPGEVLVVTQNIDDLHERGGSRSLIHMHGELLKARCTSCGAVMAWKRDITVETSCPECAKSGRVRPHVVWFGEMLDGTVLRAALASVEACDYLIVAGTSAVVQPAAAMPLLARRGGAFVLEINPERTDLSDQVASESIQAPSGVVLPHLVEAAFGG